MTREIRPRSPVRDNARRKEILRELQASISQITGAGAIMRSAVALRPPDDKMTRPKMENVENFGSRISLSVSPTIHGSNAQGSKSADVRDMYGSTYGES